MKNRFISTDLLILILTVASAAFAIAAAIVNPAAAGIVAAGLLVVLLVLGSNAKATRKIVKSIFYGSGKHSNLQQLSFEKLNIPVAIISKDTIVWYNDSFREKLLGGNDSYLKKFFPGLMWKKAAVKTVLMLWLKAGNIPYSLQHLHRKQNCG